MSQDLTIPKLLPSKHWCVLHTDDLDKILKFDLECGALYAGQLLFVMLVGVTQGSPASPGIAAVVTCWLEHANFQILFSSSSWFKSWTKRWVDDIMGTGCIVFTTNPKKKSKKQKSHHPNSTNPNPTNPNPKT